MPPIYFIYPPVAKPFLIFVLNHREIKTHVVDRILSLDHSLNNEPQNYLMTGIPSEFEDVLQVKQRVMIDNE